MSGSKLALAILVLIIIILYLTKGHSLETTLETYGNTGKTTRQKTKQMKGQKTQGYSDLPNHIWMYWENKPGHTKPTYLKLCYDTVIYHCQDNFNIHLLNEEKVYEFLPNLRRDLGRNLSIPHKTDYIRYMLLSKYGGIWIDSDTIIMRNLQDIILKLKDYDFVGFGCHYDEKTCIESTNGHPRPANWVMASRKNGKLMTRCVQKCDEIFNQYSSPSVKHYHQIGRNLIWSQIDYLQQHDPNWKYYHYSSKCVERDSRGHKLRNHRSISGEDIDTYCQDKYLFIPIYNTAPGFPSWFLKLTKEKVLTSNMLISKLLRQIIKGI